MKIFENIRKLFSGSVRAEEKSVEEMIADLMPNEEVKNLESIIGLNSFGYIPFRKMRIDLPDDFYLAAKGDRPKVIKVNGIEIVRGVRSKQNDELADPTFPVHDNSEIFDNIQVTDDLTLVSTIRAMSKDVHSLDILAEAASRIEEYADAIQTIRDAVLHKKFQLSEVGLNGGQTNAILEIIDNHNPRVVESTEGFKDNADQHE